MIIGLIILFCTVGLLVVSFDLRKQISMLKEYREDCDMILFQIKDVLMCNEAQRGAAGEAAAPATRQ